MRTRSGLFYHRTEETLMEGENRGSRKREDGGSRCSGEAPAKKRCRGDGAAAGYLDFFEGLPDDMDEEELTALETALYDRQIRVWGADAQRRLSKSRVLVSGLTGAVVEFCKNIVLAGVGSLTLIDDRAVSDDVLRGNFLVLDVELDREQMSLSDCCCESLKAFNPMVQVSVVKGGLERKDVEFFENYDAVVVGNCSHNFKKLIDDNCRKGSKRVAFYAVECRDSCGEIFVDLQNYTYMQKKSNGNFDSQLNYPSFEEATSTPWKWLPRRFTKLYFAMRVIEHFELLEGRNPGEISISDLPAVLKLRKELCEQQSLNEAHIPSSLIERLLEAEKNTHPAVCAILGGILGQEVIKALSGKGDPLKNFFFFDVADGRGVIEDLGARSSLPP